MTYRSTKSGEPSSVANDTCRTSGGIMSDSGGSVGAGWMHAEGDPPGTHRYWDGSAWQGEPQPIEPAPVAPPASPPPAFAAPPSMAPPPATVQPMGAPPMAAAAAYGSPPLAEPKKKRSTWKWLLGIALVLVLGIGGCTFALFRAISGPINLGNDYLAAVQARDFDEAWALSDPTCFDGGSPQQLAEVFVNDNVTAYDLTGSSVNTNNGTTRGSTSGTVTFTGDDVRSVEIIASKVGDDWLVCGFDIGAPGSG